MSSDHNGVSSCSEDMRLIGRITSGDRDAFAELIARYTGLIHAVATRRFHLEDTDAEDLTHDIFLSLMTDEYSLLKSYKGNSSLANWLRGVARHRCLDLKRRHALQLRNRVDCLQHKPGQEPLDKTLIVREMLGSLSPQHRAAIWHVYEGYSYQEISHLLGRPVNTVASYVYRARAKLRCLLSGSSR